MIVVKKEQTSQLVGAPELYADASDLGLRPGQWPQVLAVEEDGEKVVFERGPMRVQNDVLMAVTYYERDGSYELTVFND